MLLGQFWSSLGHFGRFHVVTVRFKFIICQVQVNSVQFQVNFGRFQNNFGTFWVWKTPSVHSQDKIMISDNDYFFHENFQTSNGHKNRNIGPTRLISVPIDSELNVVSKNALNRRRIKRSIQKCPKRRPDFNALLSYDVIRTTRYFWDTCGLWVSKG